MGCSASISDKHQAPQRKVSFNLPPGHNEDQSRSRSTTDADGFLILSREEVPLVFPGEGMPRSAGVATRPLSHASRSTSSRPRSDQGAVKSPPMSPPSRTAHGTPTSTV